MRKLEHIMVMPKEISSVEFLDHGVPVKRLSKEEIKRMRSQAIETAGAKFAIQKVIMNIIAMGINKIKQMF